MFVFYHQLRRFRLGCHRLNHRVTTINTTASGEITHLLRQETKEIVVFPTGLRRREERGAGDHKGCQNGPSPKQFALMVKYGVTPMQAIQPATSNAADLLGHSSEIGSIKPGKYADLVAVSGDPLTNISVLENAEFVMKEGKVYKQSGKSACSQEW